MKELWPLEENKYKWENIALSEKCSPFSEALLVAITAVDTPHLFLFIQ